MILDRGFIDKFLVHKFLIQMSASSTSAQLEQSMAIMPGFPIQNV